MRLKYKVFILIILIVAVSIFTVLINQYIGLKQKSIYERETIQAQEFVIDNALNNGSVAFEKLTQDYSGWDDMVTFIAKPDSSWAVVNIDVLSVSYGVAFSLVYDKNRSLIYSVYDSIATINKPVIDKNTLKIAFDKRNSCHFFQYFGDNLYEIFGSKIVPSADFVERKTPPHGYLLNGRLCDSTYLKNLKLATSFNVRLIHSNTKESNLLQYDRSEISIVRSLNSIQQKTIAIIEFSKNSNLSREINSFSNLGLMLSIVAILISIFSFWIIHRLFLSPISRISQALKDSNPKSIESLFDQNGEFKEIAQLMIDFFRQKEMLNMNNTILLQAIEQSPVTIIITDAHGNVDYVNPAFFHTTGYTLEEVKGQNLRFLKSGLTTPETYKVLWKTITSGGIWRGELINRKKNGELYYDESIISSVNGPNGSITGYIAVKNDISQRKQTELALKSNDEKLTAIIKAIPDLLFHLDKSGKFINYYQEISDKLYVPPSYFIGKMLHNIFEPELAFKVLGAIHKALKNGMADIDYELFHHELNYYSARISKLNENEVIILVRDITMQKRAEQALSQSEEKFRKLNATKDKFFEIVSHDLRSPFNSILGFSNLLAEASDHHDCDKCRLYAGQIHSSSKSVFTLLENLLEWSQIQMNQIRFHPEQINFNNLLSDILGVIRLQALNKKISINLNIPDSLTFVADNNMLHTVMRNLISNAIKFTNEHGVVSISMEQDSNFSTISVCDSGMGISPEHQLTIFDLSEKYIARGTANEKGTGIGLSLCKEFVEMHGGTIWVESEIGKGSSFKFSIPCNLKIEQ